MYVKPDRTFDMMKLKEITKVITRNLNKIIDINYYPLPEVETLPIHGMYTHTFDNITYDF